MGKLLKNYFDLTVKLVTNDIKCSIKNLSPYTNVESALQDTIKRREIKIQKNFHAVDEKTRLVLIAKNNTSL